MKIIGCAAFLILFFAACAVTDSDTPTATFLKFIEAANQKNAIAMKEQVSRGSQKMLDEAVKNQTIKTEMPETRNERIEGETAALEYKNRATGTWDKVYFVREDERWKIALERFIEETLRKENKPK